MKLRRTLPRGREQELTRWGWGGGLPWVMSWGFPLQEGWVHTSCSRLASRHGTLLTSDMNYSMSNSLAPPPPTTRGSAQSHPNTRLIYYFRCHKSSRCNCFALRWAELWRGRGENHFSISDSILLQHDCAPLPFLRRVDFGLLNTGDDLLKFIS